VKVGEKAKYKSEFLNVSSSPVAHCGRSIQDITKIGQDRLKYSTIGISTL
jgi:hypothetical protein